MLWASANIAVLSDCLHSKMSILMQTATALFYALKLSAAIQNVINPDTPIVR